MEYKDLCSVLIFMLCYQCVSSLRFGLYEAEMELFQDCSELVNISFTPSMLDIVPENTEHVVTMTACLNETNLNVSNLPSSLNVTLKEADLLTLKIISQSGLERGADETSSACYHGNFTVRTVRLGRSSVTVDVSLDDVTKCSYKYDVTVVRKTRVVDTVFNIGLVVMLAANNIGFGCKFEVDVAKKVFKAPVSLLIGFFCQYGMMPLIAFGLGRAVSLPSTLAFGLMTTGSSPGGGQSNVWTILLDGDITLSICMTLVSCFASLGMMPLWLLTLGKYVLQNDNVQIPFLGIFLSLLVLVVPLSFGLILRRCLPKVANVICKLVKPTSAIFILYLLTLGMYSYWYAILFMFTDWRILVSALLLPWAGSIISAIVAVILRRDWTTTKTIGIETAYQNAAIALLVLRSSLVQPEADLTSVMPIAITVATPIPFVIALVVKIIINLCTGKKNNEDEEKKDVPLTDINPADVTAAGGTSGRYIETKDNPSGGIPVGIDNGKVNLASTPTI